VLIGVVHQPPVHPPPPPQPQPHEAVFVVTRKFQVIHHIFRVAVTVELFEGEDRALILILSQLFIVPLVTYGPALILADQFVIVNGTQILNQETVISFDTVSVLSSTLVEGVKVNTSGIASVFSTRAKNVK
jgi:hypothetical protein